MTTPTPEQISSIVSGLTKAQRAALTSPLNYGKYGVTKVSVGKTATLTALERKDLVFGAGITSLGLAVRRALQGAE